jgi:molecular chaperone GrpE
MRQRRERMKDSRIADEIIDDPGDVAPAQADGSGLDAGELETDGISAAEARIAELEAELAADRDKYLRLAAEFDNFRKRMLKERVEAEARGQGDLVRQLLDPIDDIARFAHVDPDVTESSTLVEGVAMIEKKLDKILRAAGLQALNPVGEKFDPSLHEAVSTEPVARRDQDGTVSQVYQAGYTFKGQMLRPARVVVRQYKASN